MKKFEIVLMTDKRESIIVEATSIEMEGYKTQAIVFDDDCEPVVVAYFRDVVLWREIP